MPPLTEPASALVLFDIDGTLLRRAGPDHKASLEDAIRHVSGLDATIDGITTFGMLDRDILVSMMRNGGMPMRRIRELLPAIMDKAQSLYVHRCPDLTRKTCPGVRPLLRRLKDRGVPAGLVTGNLSRIGWCKMERAGLRPYFRFGAFAEQGTTRSRLVRLAVRQAKREGWINRRSVTALVGDHVNDIRAARDNGVRSIAVATGLIPADELAAENPDFLLRNLRDFRWEMIAPMEAE